MGKGGESSVKAVNVNDKAIQKASKLASLPTDKLRAWAKAYGLPPAECEAEKEALMMSLVRVSFILQSKFIYFFKYKLLFLGSICGWDP